MVHFVYDIPIFIVPGNLCKKVGVCVYRAKPSGMIHEVIETCIQLQDECSSTNISLSALERD